MYTWIEKDLRYIWHPYTQMKDCRQLPPILIDRAKGIKLYDPAGNFYYDTISSWWCNVHGHNHPQIKQAIKEQINALDQVLFAGFTHKPAIVLAERLVAITPKGLTKVFFSDNGSTAVEVALKMSYQYWQNIGKKKKTKFVALDYAYHGDTIGAMSVSGVDLFNGVFKPLFFASYKIPSPYCYRCPVGKQRERCAIECITPLEKILAEKNKEIAAVILEPLVMAAGGMIVYPPDYLIKAAKLAREFKVHLIVDEIATGFGRTGKMFACELANIFPDFICLSKGITSGCLALGVTLTTDEVYQAFLADYEQKKTFYHGHTYTANPLACAAAVAGLKIFKKEDTLNRMKQLIPVFHRGLEKFRALPLVGDVRYLGMIGAMELVKNKKTKQAFGLKERIGLQVYKYGLKQQLILRPLGSIIYFYLPLCVKKNEIDLILMRSFKTVQKLCG
ncbi:MAG: adenosylmethionine--8-amino-7-oxononanoate transaminase [Candidatus Omnitrophota bacterium]